MIDFYDGPTSEDKKNKRGWPSIDVAYLAFAAGPERQRGRLAGGYKPGGTPKTMNSKLEILGTSDFGSNFMPAGTRVQGGLKIIERCFGNSRAERWRSGG